MITQITGITQEMVADAPRIEEVIPELLEFLEGAVIVAHNAPFDVGFLNYELQRLKGRRLGEGAIDTLPLARLLAPGLPNYRLHTVADALGAPVSRPAIAPSPTPRPRDTCSSPWPAACRSGASPAWARPGPSSAPPSRSAIDKLQPDPRRAALPRHLPLRRQGRRASSTWARRTGCANGSARTSCPAAGHTRKVRQAMHLVERIDWDETYTPLEAVVREQELILEHRPPCNVQGSRPENYMYLKVGGAGPGLTLTMSSRQPRWLTSSEHPAASAAARRWCIGPFRGRARLAQALDLLHRCYPIRRCPAAPHAPLRQAGVRRLSRLPAPASRRSWRSTTRLVMGIVGWLGGRGSRAASPTRRSARTTWSARCRGSGASRRRSACARPRGHLLSVRRSYQSLVEALVLAVRRPLARGR